MAPLEIYRQLFSAYGPQGWWPGDSPFEVLVGAMLVQGAAWKNVERALDQLRAENLLDPHRLYALSGERLEQLLRPAGFFRVKAARLRNVLHRLVETYNGSLERMLAPGLPAAREELLSIPGVGPETADCILLYAGGWPSFVVDTYTQRVLKRHRWIDPAANYHQTQRYFESALPREPALFNEFHALLVQVGHRHCRRTPQCSGCPLAAWLPPGFTAEAHRD